MRKMAVAMEQLSAMRQALQAGENVTPVLHNLNTLLEATSSTAEVQEIGSFMSLQILFGCLNSADVDQLKACCAVLGKLLSSLPAENLFEYRQYIELGLQHLSDDVNKLCLELLKRKLSSDVIRSMVLSATMFHLITQTLGSENLQCAKLATEIFLEVVNSPEMADIKLRQAFLIDLEGLVRKGDVIRYRVYELATRMMLLGGGAVAFVQSSGLLQKLVGELDLEDILVKMNCIELLLTLLESPEGVQFLEASQVLRKLHSLLLSAQQDPFGSVIIPGVLKFFGHVALSEGADVAAICTHYPEFLRTVLAAVHSPHDDTIWGMAVDTFGVLGSTEAGRKSLKAHSSETTAALKKLGSFIADSKSELRIRCLEAATMLVSCREEDCSDWEASKSREMFHALHPKIFQVLMKAVKQPFEDLHTAGLKLLLVLANFEWGQREMHDHPGFLEYLLDRQTESEKAGKELKYEIVHRLAISGTAESVFGSPSYLKLRKYDREGPFFYSADTTVALEV